MLDLEYNDLSDRGARYLADALEVNTVRGSLYPSIVHSLFLFHPDAYNINCYPQPNRRRRRALFDQCNAKCNGTKYRVVKCVCSSFAS